MVAVIPTDNYVTLLSLVILPQPEFVPSHNNHNFKLMLSAKISASLELIGWSLTNNSMHTGYMHERKTN